jgi:SAM-dependent methyltransferase
LNGEPTPKSALPFPPLDLLQRTGHMGDEDPVGAYDQMGRGLRELIESMLPEDWSWQGRRVLDFGCGAGRVLRAFEPKAGEAEFWGCDIDRPSVAWMEENLSPPFHPFACDEEPGLPQQDGFFDLIYAISVYTHLTENWAGWLLEHHRVLADGGLLLVSFLGEGMSRPLIDEEWDEDRIGMNALQYGHPWDEGGPMTFNSPWWIRAHWGRAFEILELKPHGGADQPAGHGLALMRKRPVSLTIEQLEELEPGEPREILALQHNIDQLHDETLRLRGKIGELERERDRTGRRDQQLDELMASRSWRMTAPLRSAGGRFRRSR